MKLCIQKDSLGKNKTIRWMTWFEIAKKGVASCDKLWVDACSL